MAARHELHLDDPVKVGQRIGMIEAIRPSGCWLEWECFIRWADGSGCMWVMARDVTPLASPAERFVGDVIATAAWIRRRRGGAEKDRPALPDVPGRVVTRGPRQFLVIEGGPER